jgi:hypothetical protein
MTIGKVKDLSFNMQYYPFCFSRSDSGLVAVQNYQKNVLRTNMALIYERENKIKFSRGSFNLSISNNKSDTVHHT